MADSINLKFSLSLTWDLTASIFQFT